MVLDWHTILGGLASIILLLLIVPYIQSVLQSSTRPSAVSWVGWFLLFVIETAAQASKGIAWSLAVPLISTFSTGIIAVVALKNGRAVWTRADRVSIALAVLAVVLWAATSEPLFALIFSILADLAVTVPTIVKTYAEPASEPFILWLLYTSASTLAIVATRELTIYNLLVPIYTVLGSLVITIFARGKISHTKVI